VVLGTHVALHPLTGLAGPSNLVSQQAKGQLGRRKPVVDVFSGFITSNKTDSLDIGMVADGVNRGNASVNDVEDTGW